MLMSIASDAPSGSGISAGARPFRQAPESMLLIGGYGMTTLDFSPLFRSTIGFNPLSRLVDTAARAQSTYPPYNIDKTAHDSTSLSQAVTGLDAANLTIMVHESSLSGNVQAQPLPK